MFSDYQCPHCKTVEENLRALREIYGDEDLRIVWKNNPLTMHPNAKPAAIAGETVFRLAGDEAFWNWNRAAFDHQSSLTPENFADWAVDAGVDRAKFTAAFEANEFAAVSPISTKVMRSVSTAHRQRSSTASRSSARSRCPSTAR